MVFSSVNHVSRFATGLAWPTSRWIILFTGVEEHHVVIGGNAGTESGQENELTILTAFRYRKLAQ